MRNISGNNRIPSKNDFNIIFISVFVLNYPFNFLNFEFQNSNQSDPQKNFHQHNSHSKTFSITNETINIYMILIKMMHSNANTSYITDYKCHPEMKSFVEIYCWSSPLKMCIERNVLKKGTKLQNIVSCCGPYGPIIDLVIRATIPHMLVLYIGESTSSITSTDGKTGKLKTFLERHFKDQVILDTITKWFQTIGNASDYSNAYRQYRQAILVSQFQKLVCQPYCSVSNIY